MPQQKFSQLNRDYAKMMALRDEAFLKRSMRPVAGVLIAILAGILILLSAFYLLRQSWRAQVKQVSEGPSVVTEKQKSITKKYLRPPPTQLRRELGFYSELPQAQVKSPAIEENSPKES